jgi:hypothetical protein
MGMFPFRRQSVPLEDTKPVLLIHDNGTEPGETDIVFQECMSAHNNIHLTRGDAPECFVFFFLCQGS